MKTHKNNKIIGLSLVVGISFRLSAYAQDFTPDLGDLLDKQAMLQRVTVAKPTYSINSFMASEPPTQGSELTKWSVASYSGQYGFGYTHSYLNGSATKKNGGALSLLIHAPYKFMLSPGLGVSGSSVESLSGSDTAQSLSISPSIQISRDFFQAVTTNFLNGKLTVLGKIGYTAADSSSLIGVKPAFSQMDGWAFGGGFKYTVNATPDLQISLSPNYSYNQNETVNIPLGTTSRTHQGNLSMKLGFNDTISCISSNLVVSGFGSWLHSINFSTAPGQVESHQDWAQFGGDLMYTWNTSKGKFSLDAGYSYDAFNSSYFTHAITLQLKHTF